MESDFSLLITFKGVPTPAEMAARLRVYALGLEGKLTMTDQATAAPEKTETVAAKTDVKPKTTKVTKPKEVEKVDFSAAEEKPAEEMSDDDILNMGGAAEEAAPELAMNTDVLPVVKAFLVKRTALVGSEKAREEVTAIVKKKFGVAKVVDLAAKDFAAFIGELKAWK